jgi:hypothetical protein
MTRCTPLVIERGPVGEKTVVAHGALYPSGRIVIEWRREAFPEGERTERPTLSIYESLADAEEASGGVVVLDEDGDSDE